MEKEKFCGNVAIGGKNGGLFSLWDLKGLKKVGRAAMTKDGYGNIFFVPEEGGPYKWGVMREEEDEQAAADDSEKKKERSSVGYSQFARQRRDSEFEEVTI